MSIFNWLDMGLVIHQIVGTLELSVQFTVQRNQRTGPLVQLYIQKNQKKTRSNQTVVTPIPI